MKKFLTAVALTVSFVPVAFAQGAAAPARLHARGARAAFARLNLSADQKQQIRAIRQADRQQNQALYSSFRAEVAEYRQLRQGAGRGVRNGSRGHG